MAGAETAVPRISVAKPRYWNLALLGAYTLSGATSLAFEVLWTRMLSLQFGISIFGVVITVAAFMVGLGAGSLIGLRWGRRLQRPLLIFAALEAGVALYALALPWGFAALDGLLLRVASGASLEQWYLWQGSALLCFMLLPATAMGIGFPLVLRIIADGPLSLGKVYGVNACGAAVGALLPLILLPAFGWSLAVQQVAGMGIMVSLAAVLLALISPEPTPPGAHSDDSRLPLASMVAYAGIGGAAIMLEIGWTRLLGMVLLRTEYVLAVILAVFLVGIGIGSLIARHLKGAFWLALFPLVAALAGVASLWFVPWVARWAEQADFSSLASALWWQSLALLALSLPVTVILGAWLPLLTIRLGGAAGHGARLYGINSLGAAVGALLVGFILIPWLGTTLSIIVASLLLFCCGMMWSGSRWMWVTLLLPLLLAWPVREFPPVAQLLPQAHGGSRDLYRYEDAMSITHVVEHADGQRVLLSDLQRMDAASDPTAVALQKNQARLPLLLHPAPHSVLFLGLGTGITAAGSLPLPGLTRTAVELSRGSITAAASWFAPVNDGVVGRIRVLQDDARRFLRMTANHFDVIVGDLFHPDLVGRSALLSVQQFRRVRQRLAPDGLFVQWLALNQFDLANLQTVLRSFYRVFPHAVLFMDGFRLAMVGPEHRIAPADAVLQRFAALPNGIDASLSGHEGLWTWLGRYWGQPDPGRGVVQDEWRPQIEFALPHARFRGRQNLQQLLDWLLRVRPPLARAQQALQIPVADAASFRAAYVATDFITRSWQAELAGRSVESDRLIRFAYQANPQDRWISFALADAMLATLPEAERHGLSHQDALKAILKVRPDHLAALKDAWRLALKSKDLVAAQAYRQRIKAISPLDRAVREGGGQRALLGRN